MASRDPRGVSLLAAAGLAATLVGALVAVAKSGLADDIDAAAERAARRGPRRRKRIAAMMTKPGEPYVHIPLALIAATLVARRAGLARGAPAAAASLGGVLTHQGIKLLYRRPRPAAALAAGKREHAFPSGHTTNATAVCATAAYLLLRERMAPPAAVLPLAVAVPIVVGLTRVELEQHWLTDVIGGWIAGAGVAALCAAGYERARARS
ncbi:MAG: phosphatase PAP2 family protein [Gemmatimonadota bacterium]|nr:phosphatase PAP2 family protein [Gemmatimonadota bacterium]